MRADLFLGCHTVYSQDLNHGQIYSGVRVLNPFLE
jgi:predicted nucleic acid-binding protein